MLFIPQRKRELGDGRASARPQYDTRIEETARKDSLGQFETFDICKIELTKQVAAIIEDGQHPALLVTELQVQFGARLNWRKRKIDVRFFSAAVAQFDMHVTVACPNVHTANISPPIPLAWQPSCESKRRFARHAHLDYKAPDSIRHVHCIEAVYVVPTISALIGDAQIQAMIVFLVLAEE